MQTKYKAGLGGLGIFAVLFLLFWGFTQFHGGLKYQMNQQIKCIGEGQSIDSDSKYSWLWNTCVVNRGTAENPKWVATKRDVGVEGEGIEIE